MTQTKNTPLNLSQITQPFDLATAIGYMRNHQEVVRGESEGVAFYMYLDVKQLPVFVRGRRQFKTIETITTVTEWGGVARTLNIADLMAKKYHIMHFDEDGQPVWNPEKVVEDGHDVEVTVEE